jgi:hypothetical protein
LFAATVDGSGHVPSDHHDRNHLHPTVGMDLLVVDR